MLTKENELNSSGEGIIVTGSSENGTKVERDAMEAPSKARQTSSRKGSKSSSLTPEELLLILQEDLRSMQKAGIAWTIVPELKQGEPAFAIVFTNVKYDKGDLRFVAGSL